MLAKIGLKSRWYSTARQVGHNLQISDELKLRIPGRGASMIYTINPVQTVEQWKESVIANSRETIEQFDVLSEAKDIKSLCQNGKFEIKVNGSQKYSVYPDF